MASLLTIPRELRLQIYKELINPDPGSTCMGPPTSGPVICYRNHGFTTKILGVCRSIHDEALSVLRKKIHSTLYIYLMFNGDQPRGSDARSDLGQALKALSNSKQLQNIQTCILDIRISRGKAHEDSSLAATLHVLSFTVEEIRWVLSDAPALQEIEVAWLDYLGADMDGVRSEALQPLIDLPAKYTLVIREDKDTEKRHQHSKRQIADWPDMLKPHRKLDF